MYTLLSLESPASLPSKPSYWQVGLLITLRFRLCNAGTVVVESDKEIGKRYWNFKTLS
jgi:hypothetical protein